MSEEIRTGGNHNRSTDHEPTITYGNWSATSQLKWKDSILMQRFKRRVKRDWGHGQFSRSQEYEWFPVPTESPTQKEGA